MKGNYFYDRNTVHTQGVVQGMAIGVFMTFVFLVFLMFCVEHEAEKNDRKRFKNITPSMNLKRLNPAKQKESDSLRAVAWKKYHHNQGDE